MIEIQPADTKARQKAVRILVVSSLVGLCAILLFEYYRDDIQTWLEDNIAILTRNTSLVFIAALVFISPILALGNYLFKLGVRIIQCKRFPPANYAVSRDARVIEGSAAVRRGRLLQLLSIFLMITAGTLPVIIWQIFRTLDGNM
jgi:hypothetical protein